MSVLFSKRVILAASKLAMFYTAFVAIEVLALTFAFDRGTLSDIRGMALLLAVPFAGAFVLLAVARRWGFVALWAILASFWLFEFREPGDWLWVIDDPRSILAWSIFALPLWIIGQVGIPSRAPRRLRVGSVGPSASTALLICWALMLVVAQWIAPIGTDSTHFPSLGVARILGWIWLLLPLVVSVHAIWHVWRGTAKPVVA